MSECQATVSSQEFAEWMAFYRLEPWGEERQDLRSGIVAATIANVNRGKRQRAYRPQDFMPVYTRLQGKRRQSAQELRNVFAFMTKSIHAANRPAQPAKA